MTTVTIYHNNREITTELIQHEFYIVEDSSKQLFWYEKKTNTTRSGEFKFWLQTVDYEPSIPFIPPEWQLIIDGIWMEKKFYHELEDLKGKVLELMYEDYRFVFQID
jgi:hypothetical protein